MEELTKHITNEIWPSDCNKSKSKNLSRKLSFHFSVCGAVFKVSVKSSANVEFNKLNKKKHNNTNQVFLLHKHLRQEMSFA